MSAAFQIPFCRVGRGSSAWESTRTIRGEAEDRVDYAIQSVGQIRIQIERAKTFLNFPPSAPTHLGLFQPSCVEPNQLSVPEHSGCEVKLQCELGSCSLIRDCLMWRAMLMRQFDSSAGNELILLFYPNFSTQATISELKRKLASVAEPIPEWFDDAGTQGLFEARRYDGSCRCC